jgi:cell division protein FtsB
MANEIEVAKRRAELETLDLKRSALSQEIELLEAEADLPVLRMSGFKKLAPAAASAFAADCRAGKAKLIDDD